MILIGLTLVAAQPTQDARYQQCIDTSGGVSTVMLECGRQEIMRWDVRLNAAYQGLLKTLDPHEKSRLRVEQRAWLAQHLRETQRLASNQNEGSVAFLQSQNFELQDLAARTVALEQRLLHH